jgi:hypothetical protein
MIGKNSPRSAMPKKIRGLAIMVPLTLLLIPAKNPQALMEVA